LFGVANVEESGVIDQHVRFAKLGQGLVEDALDIGPLRDVGTDDQRGCNTFPGYRLKVLAAAADERDLGTLAQKGERNGPADA